MQPLKKLTPGSTIGIFAPGSPTRSELVTAGAGYLTSKGYKISIPLDPSANYGRTDGSFSSASVSERLNAFYSLLDDKNVSVIIAARGAYGTAELLPNLDFKRIRKANKAVVGYSDATALVAVIPTLAQIPAIHGPTVTKELAEASTNEESKLSADFLLALLSGETPQAQSVSALKPGSGKGSLIAGNLSVLVSLLGTPYEPNFKNSVLVIEEVAESPYRVHRMLMQLLLAKKLDTLQALVFGNFTKCDEKNPPSLQVTLERFIDEHLKLHRFPVVAGLSAGHGGINYALACGVEVEVTGESFKQVGSIVEE